MVRSIVREIRFWFGKHKLQIALDQRKRWIIGARHKNTKRWNFSVLSREAEREGSTRPIKHGWRNNHRPLSVMDGNNPQGCLWAAGCGFLRAGVVGGFSQAGDEGTYFGSVPPQIQSSTERLQGWGDFTAIRSAAVVTLPRGNSSRPR